MVVRDLLEGELSWVDSFVKDLLADTEKYRDELLFIPETQIKSTVEKLDTASSEFLAGLNVLTYRAEARTSDALVVIDDDIDDEILTTTTRTSTTYHEVDEELWARIFDLENELDKAKREADAEVDIKIDKMKADNEGFWSGIQGWLAGEFSLIDNLLAPLAELTSAGLAYLFSIPAETFMHFVADILVPKER